MKSLSIFLASLALITSSALAQLTINTPSNPVVCQPLLLTWSGGTPPYYLSILPGNQPTAAAIQTFPSQTGTSLTWTVNIAAGTSIGLTLKDSTGATAQSAPFTVQAGNAACLNSTTTAGATGTTSGVSTTGTATTPVTTPVTTTATTATSPTTSPYTLTTTTPKTSTTTSGSSTQTTSTPKSGAVSVNAIDFGVTGLFGAVFIALLA